MPARRPSSRRDLAERMAEQRVWSSVEADDAVLHLRAELGEIILRHAGGPVGVAEVRRMRHGLPIEVNDVQLGTVGGARYFVDCVQDREWGCPDFAVDTVPPVVGEDAGAGGAGRRPVLRSRALIGPC